MQSKEEARLKSLIDEGKAAKAAKAALGAALVLVSGLVPGWALADDDGPSAYGKHRVLQIDLPSQALAKFSHFQSKQAPGAVHGLFADSEKWQGETMALTSSGNPYTIVVKVKGKVVSDGDASTGWQAGWSCRDNPGAATVAQVPDLHMNGAKAGDRFRGEGAIGPVSVKTDRSCQPYVGLVYADDLDVDDVQVEVWSGVGKGGFVERFLPWTALATGVVFLVLRLRK